MQAAPRFTLRPARPEDAEGIIRAHVRSIREVCARDYTPEQIHAWSGRDFSADIWRETISHDQVWVVASQDDSVHGFGHLTLKAPGLAEISGLYFAPEAMGHGLGRKMINLLVAAAMKHGARSLILQSTITAQGFYERLGFKPVPGPSSVTLQNGVALPCVPMERELPA